MFGVILDGILRGSFEFVFEFGFVGRRNVKELKVGGVLVGLGFGFSLDLLGII